MTLIEKLDLLMKEKGLNRKQLSEQSDIPYMTIISFYNKGTENVKLSTLKKLAKFFNVSLDYIADDSITEKVPASSGDQNNIISNTEKEIINKLNKLTPENYEIALATLDSLINNLEKKDNQ